MRHHTHSQGTRVATAKFPASGVRVFPPRSPEAGALEGSVGDRAVLEEPPQFFFENGAQLPGRLRTRHGHRVASADPVPGARAVAERIEDLSRRRDCRWELTLCLCVRGPSCAVIDKVKSWLGKFAPPHNLSV